ncbi:unnamed protein product [Acanthoscelides obtectus]|uniref:Retinoblastoma-like protein 1 n=1 Tax=Acanthoscelides obtectus TaxID=200917 RepID=A0A9P0KSI3_ACAOB|nr:unnamed protein product [Acanthoscelides obtectus]CAK1675835.1 Retinoblastoma-like protein 1 [Acanthoscelides obtectus]
MVHSEEAEEQLHKKLLEISNKLNLDQKTTKATWENFYKINKNFVLEGDPLHWIGCAIYVASQTVETPTSLSTSASTVKSHGINITSLLRHSNLSFVQFFSNMLKWADMARMPEEFTNKIISMKNTFGVSHNTFKEYYPLFCRMFVPPSIQEFEQKQPRNRKQNFCYKPVQCNSSKIFEFTWNLFIMLKMENSQYSTDLVKSYHLLHCCLDLVFKNAFLAERRDLINPNFECLPPDWNSPLFRLPEEVPCTIPFMCKCSTTLTDAMHMKTYTMKSLMSTLVKIKVLQVESSDFAGLLNGDVFDMNFKNLTNAYESHLMNKGCIDERIFLAEYRRQLIEQQNLNILNIKASPYVAGENPSMDSPRAVAPRGSDSALINRGFSGPREGDTSPLSTDRITTQRITRLHNLINNRSPAPSETLMQLFESCDTDPLPKIQNILKTMGDTFINAYSQMCGEDEARNRLQIATTLFYKFIEVILKNEQSIRKDISGLVEKDLFYQCMFTCSLQVILFSYGSPYEFPWILDILDVQPIHFVKVIELIVRSKEPLSRELIQHLNRIEETVIESLAWRSESQLWDAVTASGQGVPKFEDTALPGHLMYNEKSNKAAQNSESPNNSMQSPSPSATDCFQSPINSKASRELFSSDLMQKTTHILIQDKDGGNKLIPVVDSEKNSVQNSVNSETAKTPSATSSPATPSAVPRRTGSLSIIFRKFYNLAGVRMEHLCSKLSLADTELKQKIWTVFEDSIRNSDLIKDRHLDQLLMCAIYMICRITKISVKFQDIMKFYREQPQCSSKVYRSVLFKRAYVQEDGTVVPEVRNDLINFYNSVYVDVMQKFAVKFRNSSQNNLLLSPLPAIKRDLVSASIQVVGNVFVKPLESPSTGSGQCVNYFFSRSPSKDLKDINRLVNNTRVTGKRLLVDCDSDIPANKRISNRKLQSLVEERRSQNSE